MGEKSRLKWRDMLIVACPRCSSPSGFQCMDPGGSTVEYVHPERFSLYEQEEVRKISQSK